MDNLIKNNGIVLLVIIGLPGLFAWLLTIINRQTKVNLVNHYGINSQVYCGFLGIIIHELSHLILALIFRHGIQSVSCSNALTSILKMSRRMIWH